MYCHPGGNASAAFFEESIEFRFPEPHRLA
jgi:hypothetical protein